MLGNEDAGPIPPSAFMGGTGGEFVLSQLLSQSFHGL